MNDSLRDRLKALGVSLGTANVKPPELRKTGKRIEEVIVGSFVQTPFGEAFIAQENHPMTYQHGKVQFDQDCKLDLIGLWGKVFDLQNTKMEQIVFLDTETSGLAGGTGTFAFMVGVGNFIGKEFQVRQFFMRDPSEETAMLAALEDFLHPFKTVVTFNGKSFDIPLMNSRYILSRLGAPFEDMGHVDLLHLARRLWRNRLERRTLGDLEREILEFARTQEEVPGWLVPQFYFDYLKSGDPQPLAGVFYHNAVDILSLAALFIYVADLLDAPLISAGVHGLDLAAIARLYQDLGKLDEAALIYEKSLEQGLPRAFFLDTLHLFGMLHRKRGEMESAVKVLERAALEGRIDSCVELAKYYEHALRDYPKAVYWTECALAAQSNIKGSDQNDPAWMELEHRLNRIRIKMSKMDFDPDRDETEKT